MPSGVFKPYAGVSTAILVFTKTEHGGTDNVWFYDMKADGFSLDDKRAVAVSYTHLLFCACRDFIYLYLWNVHVSVALEEKRGKNYSVPLIFMR